MRMPKPEKNSPEWKKRRTRFALVTLAFLLAFTGIVLGVCAWYWQWTWDMVLYYMNPANEPVALLVYIAIVVLGFVTVWLVHRYRDEKEL